MRIQNVSRVACAVCDKKLQAGVRVVDDAQELSQRLSVVLEEIKDIMNARKQRVQELRDQIAVMENENEDLERRINELIMDAF